MLAERERFLPFELFPWFRKASIAEICNVELLHPHHLYWPDLDVDVAVESFDHPDRFPLLSRTRNSKGSAPARQSGRAPGKRAGC
jgi:hypothetical protein